jgi:hypothetical protein
MVRRALAMRVGHALHAPVKDYAAGTLVVRRIERA